MAIHAMYLMPGGYLELNQSIMTAGVGYNVIQKVPVYSALVETDLGPIVVDTGLNPEGITNPSSAWGERAKIIKPTLFEEDDIRNRITQLGYDIRDVYAVINTHLHWDHTGGNRFFTHCPIYVQKAEYRFALYPDKNLSTAYMTNHFKHPLDYRLIEGDVRIIEGITLIWTPGHTPGHQSIMVELPESGLFVLAGDAIYCYETLDGPKPPGHCCNIDNSILSINRLNHLKKDFNCTLLPGHEPSFWSDFKPVPHCYK